MLPPDHGEGFVGRDAILAVATRAHGGFVFDRFCACLRRGKHQDHNQEAANRRLKLLAHSLVSKKRRDIRSRLYAHLCLAVSDQSVVNAITVFPRLASIWTFPPAATTTYCLPPTLYEDGGALTPAPALKVHTTFPLVAS